MVGGEFGVKIQILTNKMLFINFFKITFIFSFLHCSVNDKRKSKFNILNKENYSLRDYFMKIIIFEHFFSKKMKFQFETFL